MGGLDHKKQELLTMENLIIAACGTSCYAGLYGAYLFKKLQSFNTVQVIPASEVNPDDFPVKGPGLLNISQSGETADLLRVVDMATAVGVMQFNVVNKVESSLARKVPVGVFLNAGREVSVASTKAFTSQVVVLALIACWFSQNRHPTKFQKERAQIIKDLSTISMKTIKILDDTRDVCERVAQRLKNHEHLFILGKGPGESIAKEGALKIKELSNLHAEGFCSGEFKHGPLAMIDTEAHTPFILVVMDDQYFDDMNYALNQVKNRQATTIVITDCKDKIDPSLVDEFIEVPHCGYLSCLMGVFPLQMISYFVALARDCDPDRPRNLAKQITTQ